MYILIAIDVFLRRQRMQINTISIPGRSRSVADYATKMLRIWLTEIYYREPDEVTLAKLFPVPF